MGVVAGVLITCICFGIWFLLGKRQLSSARKAADRTTANAQKEANSIIKEALLEIKDERLKMRTQFEKETWERKQEVLELEKRLIQREENLDKKVELLERKESSVVGRERELAGREKNVTRMREELQSLIDQQRDKLQSLSGLTASDARKLLLSQLEEQVKHEAALRVKRMEDETRELAEKKAKEIICTAIQRCAADYVVESTVSVVSLPNDEMKGRIIGREGRNIRALENATGIDIIVDDTPEAVILSGFDPIRREIARISLERLITDGRIHPARIEEVVAKVQEEMETTIREEGENAALETGVHGLHPEEIRLMGRLRYRTSYGQNVLQHSREVAFVCGIMAAELGLNVQQAKRAGFLHDIGKAMDHEVEGSHARIGAQLAKKFNESDLIVNAIDAHHNDSPPASLIAVLTQAGDALSAARPGARRETLETYVKRLEKLEHIAEGFVGVDKTYAIQAGREIRVIIEPEKVSDAEMAQLAREITKKIEQELEYPGQIKITCIRETRSVEYAK
ncbi:MAG: ribonuclease Y [Candidatus Abyssobacteria bacterium SURF_17]|uniref:Ribonuclease Y n=1 Tax=Candidatus Abyssobacteria bacterium SURF_17 TaxID=2093361 RepID=A0A419F1J0_9BACT|nr:MAG: ribonuclease Y [Candidatus Abyssubacteria bacterium SURF_17]